MAHRPDTLLSEGCCAAAAMHHKPLKGLKAVQSADLLVLSR